MKLTGLKSLAVLAIAGMFLASCTATAFVEKDETVDFSNLNSYSWLEKENSNVNSMLENNIKQAVNQELAKSGWKQVNNRPDVLISYDVLIERAVREETTPVYSRSYTRQYYNPYTRRWSTIYYPSQFLGYDRTETPVREGTITVTLIDAKTDKTIWQGWTTDEVNSRNLSSKEIQASVKSIFKKFDIAKN